LFDFSKQKSSLFDNQSLFKGNFSNELLNKKNNFTGKLNGIDIINYENPNMASGRKRLRRLKVKKPSKNFFIKASKMNF